MNSMAEFYFATMADAPIAELLNIGGFNVERAVDIKPNFLEPEYPFDSASSWQLTPGDYLIKLSESHHHHCHSHEHDESHDHDHHHHGDDSSMPILIAHANDTSKNELNRLAEKVFVEFSAEPEVASDGQSLANINQHYQLSLEGKELSLIHI